MKKISIYFLSMVFLFASVVFAGTVQKDQPVDEKALFDKKCSTCHGIDRPQSKKKTASEWSDTVERMRGHGATLTDKEAKIIVDYLAKNYGTQ